MISTVGLPPDIRYMKENVGAFPLSECFLLEKSFQQTFFLWTAIIWVCGMLICQASPLQAQDSLQINHTFNKKRFRGVMLGGISAYGITMAGLHEAWYKENARSRFHFFNDQQQWEQLDKVGHFYSTYHLSLLSSRIYQWTGIKDKKAIWMGAVTGVVLMLPMEIQDGFSSEYGASWGDLLANSVGAALSLQRLWWDQPRIHPKFSFHPTPFAAMRPAMLGRNLPQQLLKDYNGQTYWLAFDIQPWLGEQSTFPAWLNLSVGYGATNMLYADRKINQMNGYDTYRQYYLSLDVNFSRIPVKNKVLRSLFLLLNTIHIPAPALELTKKGMKIHPLYF